MLEGLIGLILLVLTIWAVINILSSGASTLAKVLWTLFVVIFQVVGFIVWFFVGPKSNS